MLRLHEWRWCFPTLGRLHDGLIRQILSASLTKLLSLWSGKTAFYKRNGFLRPPKCGKGAVMWRYQVSNNQNQDTHETHGNCGVVAVVDTSVAALRLKPGKSKRLFSSHTSGRTCTSRRETGRLSMEMSHSRMESCRNLPISDSIPAWRELPAPAWASLIMRDAISC